MFLRERAGKLPTNTLITKLVGKSTPMGSRGAGAGRQLRAGRAVPRPFPVPSQERRPGLGRSLRDPGPAQTARDSPPSPRSSPAPLLKFALRLWVLKVRAVIYFGRSCGRVCAQLAVSVARFLLFLLCLCVWTRTSSFLCQFSSACMLKQRLCLCQK